MIDVAVVPHGKNIFGNPLALTKENIDKHIEFIEIIKGRAFIFMLRVSEQETWFPLFLWLPRASVSADPAYTCSCT